MDLKFNTLVHFKCTEEPLRTSTIIHIQIHTHPIPFYHNLLLNTWILQLIHQYPETGNNYYRLKLVDTDSSFSYSTIIPVFINAQINPITKNNFIAVFPNPSNTGEFNIDYYSFKNKLCSVKVYNILGKLVYTDNWNISSGVSHHTLRLSDMQKGIYLLNIDNEVVKIQK